VKVSIVQIHDKGLHDLKTLVAPNPPLEQRRGNSEEVGPSRLDIKRGKGISQQARETQNLSKRAADKENQDFFYFKLAHFDSADLSQLRAFLPTS
jgi:hypothetical protein